MTSAKKANKKKIPLSPIHAAVLALGIPWHCVPDGQDWFLLSDIINAPPSGILAVDFKDEYLSVTSNVFRLRYMGWNILSIPQPTMVYKGRKRRGLVKYALGNPIWIDPNSIREVTRAQLREATRAEPCEATA